VLLVSKEEILTSILLAVCFFIFRDKMSKCLEINHSISKELKNDSVCHHKMGSLGSTGKVRLRHLADG